MKTLPFFLNRASPLAALTRKRPQVRAAAAALVVVATVTAVAQEASAPDQRLSTPRNSFSQRYEINQTFDGQAYFKDNNIWVYNKDFADLFGMPAKYIAGIEGAEAAAFRIEEAPFQQCGFGGHDENCTGIDYCYLDLYFDEKKNPLPWATENRYQWLPSFSSTRWLRPIDPKEKRYGISSPDSPAGIIRNDAVVPPLVAFADPITKREAIFTSNVSNPNAGPEDIAGPVLTILGFHGNFYRSLTVVELYFPCSISSRNTINIRLDAKRAVYDQPIAKFSRVLIPEDFTSRMKDLLMKRGQRNADFYRNLIHDATEQRSSPSRIAHQDINR
jgi:hypothetical protein